MCKVHVFDEAFLLLARVAMITKNVTFSSFYRNQCKANKFFHDNHAAYQSKLSLKKWRQTVKGYLKKMSQRYIFYPIAKDPDPHDGVKMLPKITFLDYADTCHIPEWIW